MGVTQAAEGTEPAPGTRFSITSPQLSCSFGCTVLSILLRTAKLCCRSRPHLSYKLGRWLCCSTPQAARQATSPGGQDTLQPLIRMNANDTAWPAASSSSAPWHVPEPPKVPEHRRRGGTGWPKGGCGHRQQGPLPLCGLQPSGCTYSTLQQLRKDQKSSGQP